MLYKSLKNLIEEKFAPKDPRKFYEPYGIQYRELDEEKNIRKVLLTVDINIASVRKALTNRVELILSHHPLIDRPLNKIDGPLIKIFHLLSRYPISIFTMNSSFIYSEYGVINTISELLYLNTEKRFQIKNRFGDQISIGKICRVKHYPREKSEITLKILLERIKMNLNLEYISYLGNLKQNIEKIFLTCENHFDDQYLDKILSYNCDCLISYDLSYRSLSYLRNAGISIIDIPHYEIDFITLKKLYNFLNLEFPNDIFLIFESEKLHKSII